MRGPRPASERAACVLQHGVTKLKTIPKREQNLKVPYTFVYGKTTSGSVCCDELTGYRAAMASSSTSLAAASFSVHSFEVCASAFEVCASASSGVGCDRL